MSAIKLLERIVKRGPKKLGQILSRSFKKIPLENQLLQDYADRYFQNEATAIVTSLLKTGQKDGVAIIIYALSKGKLSAEQFWQFLEHYRDPAFQTRARQQAKKFDRKALAILEDYLSQSATSKLESLRLNSLQDLNRWLKIPASDFSTSSDSGASNSQASDSQTSNSQASDQSSQKDSCPKTETKRAVKKYDVVLLNHWHFAGSRGGNQNSNLEELKALAAAKVNFAVANLSSLWLTTSGQGLELSPKLLELSESLSFDLVELSDQIEAKLVVLRYPPTLQFSGSLVSNIKAEKVVIAVNQTPHDADGSALRYSVETAAQTAQNLFGSAAQWYPMGEQSRAAIAPLMPSSWLAAKDIPAIVNIADWRSPRIPLENRKAVVGRYSRDNLQKWPDKKSEVEAAYTSSYFDTVVMGGSKAIVKHYFAKAPGSWKVYAEGEIPPQELLAQIDFFVYFHSKKWTEAFGRSIIEAFASGRVVILPRSFEPVFGAAAIYAVPAEVPELIKRYYENPELYQQQVELADQYLEKTVSYRSYQELVQSLLP